MLFRLLGLAVSAIARVAGLATLDALSALKSIMTAGVLLGGFVVGAAMLVKSCSGPDAGQWAEQARRVRTPSPLFKSLRGPTWDDDEIVTIVEPGGRTVEVRWGDIREEERPRLQP